MDELRLMNNPKNRRRRALGLVVLVAGSIAAAHSALAQAVFNPYVDAHYEHDSNVFRAPNSEANIVAFGDPKLDDTDLKSVIGMDAKYLWSEQKLTATVEGRRFIYDHYSNLDHNEYLADVALNWQLTSLLDGLLEARQEQTMAQFSLNNSTQLTIDVDRKINLTANLNFNPDWRLETGVYDRNLKSPLQFYPDLIEKDVGTHLGLLNRSQSNLTYGIIADHISGSYENAPTVGSFNQTSAQLTLRYTASGLSTFNGAVGYTKRDQDVAGGNISAVTGLIGYTRQLTPKTNVTVNVSRNINSYLAAGGSEIDLSSSVAVTWQATYRIGVTATVGYLHSTFEGQVIPGSNAAGRVDKLPTESLKVIYQPLRRLQLQAYLNNSSRSSNVAEDNFSDSIVGIEAKFTWL